MFDALPPELAEESIDIEGTIIQRFGDGYEEVVEAFGRQLYRVPKMDGAFHVERSFGVVSHAVTGGMFLILAESDETALAAAEASLAAVSQIPLVVVKNAASGSKVGAKSYRDMVATTNHHYCPTLAGDADSALPDSVRCVYEIIVSAPREDEVRRGMRAGIEAATSIDGVRQIHTANYGGKLGKGKIHLHQPLRVAASAPACRIATIIPSPYGRPPGCTWDSSIFTAARAAGTGVWGSRWRDRSPACA